MDFIRVTLIEKLDNQKIADLKRLPEHLLPLSGIKSISKKIGTNNTYYIEIKDSYIPKGLDFIVGFAEAELPREFVRIIND